MSGPPGRVVARSMVLLGAAPGRRPAVDEPAASTDPDVVVQVERRPDLAGREVELAAQRRQRIVHLDGRVLVADPESVAAKPIGTGGPYSMPTTRRPMSSTIRPGWRLITRAPDRDGTPEREGRFHSRRLHQRVDAGLDLGDHRVGDRLRERRRPRRRHDLDREPRVDRGPPGPPPAWRRPARSCPSRSPSLRRIRPS